MPAFDPLMLREAFGAYITGVTVVTTYDEQGKPRGFTANSFTSVSLDPPLLLVCPSVNSPCLDALKHSKGFAINILAEQQQDVSQTFATPVEDRFATVKWQAGPHGFPIFEDVSAWFDCSTFKMVEAGDHIIMIGQVEAFKSYTLNALGYARGRYFTPSHEREAVSAASSNKATISAIIERGNEVLVIRDEQTEELTLPSTLALFNQESGHRLGELLERIGVKTTVGFIYSVYQHATTQHQHIVYRCIAEPGEPKDGEFIPLRELDSSRINDPATQSMMKRYVQESRVGNYGVYLGDQRKGVVQETRS